MIFFLQSLYLEMIVDDNPRMQRRNLNLVKMNYKIIINDWSNKSKRLVSEYNLNLIILT